MENELQILSNIEKNKAATQRDIAKNTGMSLGNVNILIKRLVNKGLVKIEKLSPRSIRYILTPEGIKEKTEATYRYIVSSYRLINDISNRIDSLINSDALSRGQIIILFGEKDEIYKLLSSRLRDKEVAFKHIQAISCQQLTTDNQGPIITWHPAYAVELSERDVSYINLLEQI